MFPFDEDATQVLRRAGRLANGKVGIEHLEQAIASPEPSSLPPTTIKASPPLQKLLERADALAERRGAATISRADLYETLVETNALAAGLDLDRLRFVRWQVERRYPTPPGKRCCQDLSTR